MMPRTFAALGLALLSGFAAAEEAAADDVESATPEYFIDARHIVGVGVAYQSADTEIRASVRDLADVKIDLDDLGVDDNELSAALEYRWRFAPRWALVALAYRFDESGDQTVKRDFNFDGQEFTAGLAVDTSLRVDTYILDVLYSLHRSDRLELYLGGGIHAFDLDASIRARAFVEEGSRSTEAAGSELLAPLPNLRMQLLYKLPGNWSASLAAGWLSANYDDYDGSFAYVHPRLAYVFGNRWALTAGYQYVDIELMHSRSRGRELEFNSTFKGPTLFLDYRF